MATSVHSRVVSYLLLSSTWALVILVWQSVPVKGVDHCGERGSTSGSCDAHKMKGRSESVPQRVPQEKTVWREGSDFLSFF